MELCPHCGYNFTKDEPLERGDWLIYSDGAYFKGTRVALTPAEAGIFYAIAKANGRPITVDALLNRVSDSDNQNVISVLVHRLRKRLPEVPFVTAGGRGFALGYRWAA